MGIRLTDPITKFGPRPTIDLPSVKQVWTYLPVLLLLVGLGAALSQVTQRQQLFTRASGGATLSLVLEKSVVKPGEEFTAQVFLDKEKSEPTHAYLSLSFAPDELEIVDGGPTHQRIELGMTSQSIHLGEVRFRALKPVENSRIEYSSETWVAGMDNLNLIRRTIGAEVDIRP